MKSSDAHASPQEFHARLLLSPRYLLQRLATVRSLRDLLDRVVNLFVLLAKLCTGRYGRGYWDNRALRASVEGLPPHRRNEILNDAETLRVLRCAANPVNLFVVLTNACNLDCLMCPRIAEPPLALSLETVRAALAPWLPTAGYLDWEGGEAFALPWFLPLLGDISSAHPHIVHSVTTNGTLLYGATAGFLADRNVRLTFSIDSVDPGTYERLRRGARFDRLLENLAGLKAAYERRGRECAFTLNAVVMRSTAPRLALLPAFCARHGIRQINLIQMLPRRAPHEDIFAGGNAADLERLARSVEEVRDRCREHGIRLSCGFTALLPGRKEPAPRGSRIAPSCARPWNTLHFLYDGSVRPNCLCDAAIGNVHAHSADELWNGEKMMLYRRKIMEGRAADVCSRGCLQGLVMRPVP